MAEISLPPGKLFLKTPDTGVQVTYGELKGTLNSFSNALTELGIANQQVVSVMMQNSWGSVQVILGTLYGGRITAPVNLAAGDPQIASVIEHSETLPAPPLLEAGQKFEGYKVLRPLHVSPPQ